MKADALSIFNFAVNKANPYSAVYNYVSSLSFDSPPVVIAAGKAASPMARAAFDALSGNAESVTVLTKYNHAEPDLPESFTVSEAAHPVPDENGINATDYIINKCTALSADSHILFLLSGGASALFEEPEISLAELQRITDALLACSAEINEINTVRKRLSRVKGGRFALMCKCKITCVILSDVIGGNLADVASGPCCADNSTSSDAFNIINKYNIPLSPDAQAALGRETPKELNNVTLSVVGDISILCKNAADKAHMLGYNAIVVNDALTGEARTQAREICSYAAALRPTLTAPTALIYGGETTVTINGTGKGGRNQEMALTAAIELDSVPSVVFLSAGSDGTDGPTDAAGGIADGSTAKILRQQGVSPENELDNNNSYFALSRADSLIITGATGTNVNDLTLILINNI